MVPGALAIQDWCVLKTDVVLAMQFHPTSVV
jgi:hypothetical protein